MGVARSSVCAELEGKPCNGKIVAESRRGNPYDNQQAESLMKTLKVEDVSLMAYETFDDVAVDLPRYIEAYDERRLHSALG